jgi:D-alanine-D-alanine ligase
MQPTGSIRPRIVNDLRPIVWALIPYTIEENRLSAESYEREQTKWELADAFCRLGLSWVWQPMVLSGIGEIIGQLQESARRCPTVVFNFCDGYEDTGVPGVSVVKALEATELIFTGSSSRFYEISSSKIWMKELFEKQGVATPGFAVLPRSGPVCGLCERLGVPLFVKPDASSASCGIGLKSKVWTDEETTARRDFLITGENAKYFGNDQIFVERYMSGDEYTVLVFGYWDQPEKIWNMPPGHRAFAKSIPQEERFLSYDRYWAVYSEESAPADNEPFYHYELALEPVASQVAELARRAFIAVEGWGYARVDIRSDLETGELSVLEVNANCGLSGDEQTSSGNLLRLMGWNFPGLLGHILEQTLERGRP